jgi:hypothetical protein
VVPVLAEAGATTFPQLVTPLLGATVAAVVLWLVALLVVAFATRPRDIDPARPPWTSAKSLRRLWTC